MLTKLSSILPLMRLIKQTSFFQLILTVECITFTYKLDLTAVNSLMKLGSISK